MEALNLEFSFKNEKGVLFSFRFKRIIYIPVLFDGIEEIFSKFNLNEIDCSIALYEDEITEEKIKELTFKNLSLTDVLENILNLVESYFTLEAGFLERKK